MYNRKEYQKCGTVYVTYASSEEAKLSLLMLNQEQLMGIEQTGLCATLKENLMDFHLDTEFLYQKMSFMKTRYRTILDKIKMEKEFVSLEELQQEQDEKELSSVKEARMKILEELATKENVKKELSDIVMNEFLNTDENWQLKYIDPEKNYDADSVGRQFNNNTQEDDFKRLQSLIKSGMENVK